MNKIFSRLLLACALTVSLSAFAQDQMKQDDSKKDDTMKNYQMKPN